jgi:hypothetical protein
MAAILSGLQPFEARAQGLFNMKYRTCLILAQARTTGRGWSAVDEAEFTELLEKELDKIHDFQKAKACSICFCSPVCSK